MQIRNFRFSSIQLTGLWAAIAICVAVAACGNAEGTEGAQANASVDPSSPFAKFRTGRFRYEDQTWFGDFTIIRTETEQVDSGGATGLVAKFDLKWESDSTYTLVFKEIVANPKSIQLGDTKGLTRKCTMSEPNDTSYLETSTSTMNEMTLKSRIIEVKSK